MMTVALVVLGLAGCASTTSTTKAVTGMNSLAGRWVGTCDFGSGLQPCSVLIGQEGQFTGIAGSSSVFGRVNPVGGRGAFDVGTAQGDIDLYERATCRREIVVTGSRGMAKGQLAQDGPAAVSVGSIANVVGRWAGTCDFGGGPVSCTVNIAPDGTFTGTAGANSAAGRVTVVNGRATFDTGTAAGDIVLHEGTGCPRQISVVGSRGIARGSLTAQ